MCSEEGHGLLLTFFGDDGKQQLDLTHFSNFCRALHAELVRLEFLHYDHDNKVWLYSTVPFQLLSDMCLALWHLE